MLCPSRLLHADLSVRLIQLKDEEPQIAGSVRNDPEIAVSAHDEEFVSWLEEMTSCSFKSPGCFIAASYSWFNLCVRTHNLGPSSIKHAFCRLNWRKLSDLTGTSCIPAEFAVFNSPFVVRNSTRTRVGFLGVLYRIVSAPNNVFGSTIITGEKSLVQ